MSKAISYLDWALGFKSTEDEDPIIVRPKNNKKFNSIGIAEDYFKDYIKKWKTENLV